MTSDDLDSMLRGGLVGPGDLASSFPSAIDGYEVERLLGSGAAADVYLARDPAGRRVAVKVLGALKDPRRFQREVQVLRRIRHQAVVELLGSGLWGQRPYLVMAHAGDRTLADVRLGWREALPILAEVARACHAAHAQGVVHRDLKPSNVVIDDRLAPIVVDFGVAHPTNASATSLTSEGALVGTPAYMAPEQVTGPEIGPATDVYALGAMLYEVLTGKVPFEDDGGGLTALMARIVSEPPAPPRRLSRDIPRWLESVALRALAKAPAARHESALAFAQALDGPSAGRPRGRRAQRWLPWLAAVAALVLLGAAVARERALRPPSAATSAPAPAPVPAPSAVDPPPRGGAAPSPIEEPWGPELLTPLWTAGKWAEARQVCAAEVARRPGSAPAHAWLTWLTIFEGAPGWQQGAEEACARALELDPDDPDARWARAELLGALGQRSEALREAERAVALDARHARAWKLAGTLRADLGDDEGALRDLDHAIAHGPDFSPAWHQRGFVRYRAGSYHAALQDLTRAAALGPPYAGTHFFRAACLVQTGGSLAEARAELDLAIERTKSPWRDAHVLRADVALALGDPAGALVDLTSALTLVPGDGAALALRVRARRALGDAAGALDDCREALRLLPPGDRRVPALRAAQDELERAPPPAR